MTWIKKLRFLYVHIQCTSEPYCKVQILASNTVAGVAKTRSALQSATYVRTDIRARAKLYAPPHFVAGGGGGGIKTVQDNTEMRLHHSKILQTYINFGIAGYLIKS